METGTSVYMESMTVDKVLNKDNTEEQVSNEKIDSSVIGEDSQFPCEKLELLICKECEFYSTTTRCFITLQSIIR